MKRERPIGWFFNHVFSALYLNFSYESSYFWWGKDNPWDKNEIVQFRFLKLFCANLIALITKCTFACLFFIARIWLDNVSLENSIKLTAIASIILMFCAFIGAVLDIKHKSD